MVSVSSAKHSQRTIIRFRYSW